MRSSFRRPTDVAARGRWSRRSRHRARTLSLACRRPPHGRPHRPERPRRRPRSSPCFPAARPPICAWRERAFASANAAQALAAIAAALGLPDRPRAETPEALYAAERALLDGFRVIPLFHLPDLYAVAPRVKGGPGITPLGEWRFENLWLEGGRP